MAALEGGSHGIAFASGSAATAAIAELAGPGQEIVVGDDVYGGTFRYLERVRKGAGVEPRFVDLASGPDVLWEALTSGPASSGSRRRPTRCSRSSTSRRWPRRSRGARPMAGRGR